MNLTLRASYGIAVCLLLGSWLHAQQQNRANQFIDGNFIEKLIPTTLPDGTTTYLELKTVSIMSDDLARAEPSIHTFRVANKGLRGAITFAEGEIFGDLEYEGQWLTLRRSSGQDQDLTLQAVLLKSKEMVGDGRPACGTEEVRSPTSLNSFVQSRSSILQHTNGTLKRSYRLAIVGTGEFYANNGGNQTQARAVIVQTVSFANLIFENDLAVSFTLVEPKIYEDAATDPFTPDQKGGDQRVNQAAEVIAENFAPESYDVGMVFHRIVVDGGWSGGGVAYVGVVCDNDLVPDVSGGSTPNEPDGKDGPYKAGAWSGSFNNTNIGWKRLVTHELAHMLGGSHTFNGTGNSCSGNIALTSAVEIGSGTTLLSYADLCGSEYNTPYDPESSSYFHQFSITQMLSYMERQACNTQSESGNIPPQVTANACSSTTTIPIGTPFLLRGSATDSDSEILTYSWEQIDEDGPGTITQGATLSMPGSDNNTAGASELAPLFRSYPASEEPVRYFPANLSGQSTEFEVLPQVARSMTFALTVRDNHPGAGGIAMESVQVNVDQSGPLTFRGPTETGPLASGETYLFEWETNGSDALCDQVTIQLALNDSGDYTYTLGTVSYAAETATLRIPAGVPSTDRLRFRLLCSDQPCQTFYAVDQTLRELRNEACSASASNIYPEESISAAVGSVETVLQMNTIGGAIDQLSMAGMLEEQNASFTYRRTNSDPGSCVKTAANVPVDTFTIIPSKSGEFVFQIGSGPYYIGLTLFEESYDPDNGCTTWMGSMFGQGFFFESLTATLTAGRKYVLVVSPYDEFTPSRDNGPLTYSVLVSRSPTGNQWLAPFEVAPDNKYTYLAATKDDGYISAVSEDADFSMLSAGNYRIYGLSHSASVVTKNWVGSKLSSVLMDDEGGCRQLSDNSRRMSLFGAQVAAPVDWLTFTGTTTPEGVALEWSVNSETENDYFAVQRSSAGKEWQNIGRVAGGGTNDQFATYGFLDPHPESGLNLYRLVQVDFDGSEHLSTVVSVGWTNPDQSVYHLFPNPFVDFFEVRALKTGAAPARLYDPQGRDLSSAMIIEAGPYQSRIQVPSLPSGLYLLRWGEKTFRIVKR